MPPWEKYQKQDGPWSKYAPAEPQVGYAEDMARGVLSGIRQGVEGIAGMMGDAQALTGRATSWIAEKLGASPETAETIGSVTRRISPVPFAPTSAEIRGNLTDPVVGEAYDAQTVPGEYMQTIGQFLPGALAGPGTLPQRLVTQTLLPALGSETAGQLTKDTAYEPYARIVGALAGGVAPSLLRRAVTPFPTSPERTKMADALTREGVDLTAGQRTGSDRLRYMESELGGLSGQQFMERQGEQFTKAALQRAGVNANRASPEVIDDAFNAIGKQFDDLARRNYIKPDQTLVDDFIDVWRDYSGKTSDTTRIPVVRDTIEDIVTTARNRGTLPGDYYQSMRSQLGRAAQGTSNPEAKIALREIQDVLDDAMERTMQSIGSPDMPAWQQARKQYRNMLVLEQAATGAGENAAMGIISPSQLRNATVMKQGRRAYARGRGDFADLARAGEAVMKPLPQSGTAPRAAARNLGVGLTSMLGAGGGAAAGGPYGAIAGALVGSAVPGAAGRAMLSAPGRAYLGNQLVPPGGGLSADATRAAIVALLAGQNNRPAVAP